MTRTPATCLALAVSLGLILAAPVGAQPAPPPGEPWPAGVQCWLSGPDQAEVDRLYEAGFRWLRLNCPTLWLQDAEGHYDFSRHEALGAQLQAKGMGAVLCLSGTEADGLAPHTEQGRAALAAYAGELARVHHGRGFLYEIWNEPNTDGFWPPKANPADYVALARAMSAAIKQADPAAIVLGGSLSGMDFTFLEACCREGLLEAVDGIAVHPYRTDFPETVLADYARMRVLLARYAPPGKALRLVSSEWGYSAIITVNREQQGHWLPRMFLANLLAGVTPSIWFQWLSGDKPGDNESNFGVRTAAGEPLPAYYAAQTLTRELEGGRLLCRLPGREDDYLLLFRRPEGYCLAAWTMGGEREVRVRLYATGESAPPSLPLVAQAGERSEAPVRAGQVELRLGSAIQYVEAPASRWLRLQEAVTVTADSLTALPGHEALIISVGNPETQPLPGRVSVRLLGSPERPQAASVAVPPGGRAEVRLAPAVAWDGVSAPMAEVTVALEGLYPPLRRRVDLGSAQRVAAYPTCPIGHSLAFVVTNPRREPFRGKLRLLSADGLALGATEQVVEAQGETLVRFPLTSPAAESFTLAYELQAADGAVVLRSPLLEYRQLDVSPDQYQALLEGDETLRGSATATAAEVAGPVAAEGPLTALRLDFDFENGRAVSLVSGQERPLPAGVQELGVWVRSEAPGLAVRSQIRDAQGRDAYTRMVPLPDTAWHWVRGPLANWDYGWGYALMPPPPQPPWRLQALVAPFCYGAMQGSLQVGPALVVVRPAPAQP